MAIAVMAGVALVLLVLAWREHRIHQQNLRRIRREVIGRLARSREQLKQIREYVEHDDRWRWN
jgi:hypothetical protein